MVSYVLNVDKAGDLKFGRKKCRLHKKSEVVQVAKEYGIRTPSKKTVSDLCGRLKKKIQKAERVSREEWNKIRANQNNIPLAKLYPEAAKKRAAAKKKAEDDKLKAQILKEPMSVVEAKSEEQKKLLADHYTKQRQEFESLYGSEVSSMEAAATANRMRTENAYLQQMIDQLRQNDSVRQFNFNLINNVLEAEGVSSNFG